MEKITDREISNTLAIIEIELASLMSRIKLIEGQKEIYENEIERRINNAKKPQALQQKNEQEI